VCPKRLSVCHACPFHATNSLRVSLTQRTLSAGARLVQSFYHDWITTVAWLLHEFMRQFCATVLYYNFAMQFQKLSDKFMRQFFTTVFYYNFQHKWFWVAPLFSCVSVLCFHMVNFYKEGRTNCTKISYDNFVRQFCTTILCYNFENCRINLCDIYHRSVVGKCSLGTPQWHDIRVLVFCPTSCHCDTFLMWWAATVTWPLCDMSLKWQTYRQTDRQTAKQKLHRHHTYSLGQLMLQ